MPTVTATTFGQKVQVMRKKAGLTQEQLAARADLTVSTIRKLEQRRSEPSWETAQKIAAALGVSLDKFAET